MLTKPQGHRALFLGFPEDSGKGQGTLFRGPVGPVDSRKKTVPPMSLGMDAHFACHWHFTRDIMNTTTPLEGWVDYYYVYTSQEADKREIDQAE